MNIFLNKCYVVKIQQKQHIKILKCVYMLKIYAYFVPDDSNTFKTVKLGPRLALCSIISSFTNGKHLRT